MNDLLTLPTGPLAEASLRLARESESVPLADHSIRSFLFARLLARQEGSINDAAYDEDLLFVACALHDVGLGSLATSRTRFEVEGADLAASLLAEHGIAAADIDRVWEAIALHTSLGIADRRGLLSYLTYKGVFNDTGRFTDIDASQLQPMYSTYPRSADDRFFEDAIVKHAGRSEAAAPPYSASAEFLRRARDGA